MRRPDRRRSRRRSAACPWPAGSPNDRMVRSWISPVVGIDRETFGEHPAQRHVRGADRVGTEHDRDRADRRRRPAPALVRSGPASSHSTRAPASAPPATATHVSSSTARARVVGGERGAIDAGHVQRAFDAARRARRARPRARPTTSAGPVTSALDHSPASVRSYGHAIGATNGCEIAGDDAAHVHGAVVPPRARGDRRALGPEAHDVFAGVHAPARRVRSGRRARAPPSATGDVDLAAERAAVGERRRGRAPRFAPRRVGFEVRGLHPAGGEPHGARLARRAAPAAGAGSTVVRRPCTLPASARASSSEPADHPVHAGGHASTAAVEPGGRGTATSASRGARSSANPPSPRGTSAPTICGAPPSSSARRAAAGERTRPRSGRPQRRRSPRTRSASRCTGRGARRAPRSRSTRRVLPRASAAATRTRIPGVQKPHCEPPVATKRAASRSRTAASRPSTVVTARPSTRVAGVTHATRGSPSTSTVQQPHCPWGAHPSFTESDTEALAQHREQRLAGRGVDLDLLVVAHELHPMPSSGHGQAG